jgi:hypothetical protein
MARASTLLTLQPNGVGQLMGVAKGGAAGALTLAGIKSGDRILQVLKVKISGSVVSVADLTSEFTVAGTDSITNAAGTATSLALVLCTYSIAAGNM